ncbi:molecular chaperone DnaJ [uncultured Pseudoteredinibacter sp.]|uniref:molecular chaperone DnaJ n=1 Tax=uncultured Pseudoteredinibacter sp. TaxID=1641701 RepID=UPI00260E6B03|nr:molecular chaperone DnaJ [uncultured Pseudoteredinibacter sp.]
MAKLIILLAFIFLAWYLRNRFISTPKADRKRLITGWLLWLTVAIVVAMALTGRLHWIGGLMALSVPFLRQFALWFMQRKLNEMDHKNSSAQELSPQSDMDRPKALQILNLGEQPSREEIIQAHRKMMQKNHPDQGGSDYLAAMLNQAKDLLIKELNDDE